MRWRVALFVGFLAFGVVVLELVARHLCSTDEQRRERLLTGDAYWIDRWLSSTSGTLPRKPEEMAPLATEDRLHRYDERLGWVPRENAKAEEVSTNSIGLRGSRETPFEKPAGEHRIVVVGDSFTFGDGVKDDEVWTAKLEQKLAQESRPVIVLNLGVEGYGLDQQCLRLEQLGMKLAPDLVLAGVFGDDLDRNELSVRDAPKPRFLLDGDGLKLDNVPVPTPEQLRAHVERQQIGSYAWAMFRKMASARSSDAPDATKWELARRILDRMKKAAEDGGARFAVAYFPKKAVSFGREADAYEQTIVTWANSHGVALINLRETFNALGSPRFRDVWKNHWTPFGNETVAVAIHDGLNEFNALPK